MGDGIANVDITGRGEEWSEWVSQNFTKVDERWCRSYAVMSDHNVKAIYFAQGQGQELTLTSIQFNNRPNL